MESCGFVLTHAVVLRQERQRLASDDCGWVDFVQWTGLSPRQDPTKWDTITYKYDPSGRRIKKTVDGYATTYLYDGDHIIAEYDGNSNLLRKYVYGPRVDEPVCMIDPFDCAQGKLWLTAMRSTTITSMVLAAWWP